MGWKSTEEEVGVLSVDDEGGSGKLRNVTCDDDDYVGRHQTKKRDDVSVAKMRKKLPRRVPARSTTRDSCVEEGCGVTQTWTLKKPQNQPSKASPDGPVLVAKLFRGIMSDI